MSNSVSIPIIKGTDRDYFEALLAISKLESAKQLGFSAFSVQSVFSNAKIDVPSSIDEAISHEPFQKLLSAEGKALRSLTLLTGNSQRSIQFHRSDDFANGKLNGMEDRLSINLDQQADPATMTLTALLIAEIQKIISSFSINSLQGLLGEQATSNLVARQEALTRLETMHSTMLHDFMKQRTALDAEFNSREESLQTSYQKRQDDLEQLYADRHAEFAARESELSTQRQDLDDRSSTHVRRELRKNLKEILTARQSSFALSRDTHNRRRFVFWGYVLLLILFGIPAGYLLYNETTAGSFNPWTFGRQIVFTIAFIVTSGFFLRWLNTWAQQHAEEEFKLKQLELDIDRASWVVEMALEWRAAKGDELPAQLADRLSANLFGSSPIAKSENHSMTASDAIVKALQQSASNIELNFPGGKVSLDKRAIKNASD